MKLRNNILFPIIYVFVLLFTLTSLFIVETTHNRFLKLEINRINNLSKSSTQQLIFSLEYSKENVLRDLFRSWNNQYTAQKIWFTLFSEIDELVITTIPSFDKDKLFSLINSNNGNHTTTFNIQKNGDSVFLISDKYINLPDSDGDYNRLIVIEEITSIFQNRTNFYTLFGIMGVSVIFLFLIISRFLLSEVLKPLKTLTKATIDLEHGHFNSLSEEPYPAEELLVLCKNFNRMAHIIKNQMKSLEEENNKKQYFINTLTHELNTPLTSIIGHSDLILSANLPIKKQTDSLLFIYEEGKRIRNMIDQLFMLVVDQTLEKSTFTSIRLIRETMNIWDSEARKNNVSIVLDGDDFTVEGNLELLKVAIGNFIHNGIKAASPQGTVYIRQNKDEQSLYISDTGRGVKTDLLNQINIPYYRDMSTDRERGLGLGVSIADEILKKHGFSFNLTQNPDCGLEILIYLKSLQL